MSTAGAIPVAGDQPAGQGDPVDLAALLDQQLGLVARPQLLAIGWTDARIKAQLVARRWQRVHAGVYAACPGG